MMEFFRQIDGPDLETVEALPGPTLEMNPYLPQVRAERALRGFLHEDLYGVRASVVIGSRPTPLMARDLKQLTGMDEKARLVLLFFDDDGVIERIFQEARTLMPQLQVAGYDAVVAPSYSCWWPRPRADHLYNLKRSLWVYAMLQRRGVPCVPRVAWATEDDAQRFASWVRTSTSIEWVALDLMTYRADDWWDGQIRGLAIFDQVTGGRLRYLINGPSRLDRFADIFQAVDHRRVMVSNLAIARPPRGRDQRDSGFSPESGKVLPIGLRFQREIARDRQLLLSAAKRAGSGASRLGEEIAA